MRTLVFILFGFTGLVTHAQELTACGYYGDNAKFSSEQICKQLGYENTTEAEQSIASIMDQLGLQMNFLVVECNNIRNAVAVNFEGDIGLIRYIIYDKGFLDLIEMKSQSSWSGMSILAHEIGHHLNGHTLDGLGSRPPKELEADEFSGFVLYKLGATLEEAQAAMVTISPDHTSETHPGKADRLEAIANGWQNAEALAPKYKELSRNADYTTYAKMWFQKAYSIKGNAEQDHINRVAYYGKATEYRADYAEAYRNRAKYLNILGLNNGSEKLLKEALKDANRAISIDKNLWNAYVEKATAFFGMKRYDDAIKYYSIAIDGREQPSEYDYAARGWTYYKKGQKVLARKDLQEALEIRPGWKYAQHKLKLIDNN